MYSYIAYGLGIRSSLALPELTPSAVRTDIVIQLGTVDRCDEEKRVREGFFRISSEEVRFFKKGVGKFLARGGREIIIEPCPGVADQLLRLFILGPILGALLRQRGSLVLHASAAAMDGGAVAFLGGSGRGKSTVVAALHRHGYGILVDDILALSVAGKEYLLVFPGFAQLKLWPETVAALGESFETLPRIHPEFQKRARRVDRKFPRGPLPLKRIYVLADGPIQNAAALRPGEAIVELVHHSYRIRSLQSLGAAPHFQQCAELASTVPVWRLTFQRSLRELPSLVELVEQGISHDR